MDRETRLVLRYLPKLLWWCMKQACYRILLPGGTVLIVGQLTWLVYKKVQMHYQLGQKTEELQASIEVLRKRLQNVTPNNGIIDLDLTELYQRLQQSKLSPLEVLQAYQSKALKLYDNGNSGICEFVREAEQQAIKMATVPNRSKLLLCGIPVSVKELCTIAGYDSTFGLIKYCNQPVLEDCAIIKALKAQGAIPFVLTSTSQAASSLSGFNPVFGDMSNPHSNEHEPGGSSSGEGVLLALKGSPIGLGTDLAGSIRIPASFCGVAGLKPTGHRLSNFGVAIASQPRDFMLRVCVGPMGRKTSDLAFLMRGLLQPSLFSLDSQIPPIPFNETVYAGLDKPKLRIGFYDTLASPDLIQTVPSIRRGVKEAVDLLKRLGHELVPFTPPEPSQAFRMALKLMNVGGPESLSHNLYGEPANEHTRFLKIVLKVPHLVKLCLEAVCSVVIGKPTGILNTLSGPRSLSKCLKLCTECENYMDQFKNAWLEAGDLDALICPVSAFPAPPKSALSMYVTTSIIYTLLYNLIDYPAGTIRISRVTQDDIQQAVKLSKSSNNGLTRYQRHVLKTQENSVGLPIGVQVVAKPYREEVVLRVMRELESQVTKI